MFPVVVGGVPLLTPFDYCTFQRLKDIQRQHLKIQNHGDSSFPCFSQPVLVPHGFASNCARLGNWNPARAPALPTDVRLAGLEIYWNDAV